MTINQITAKLKSKYTNKTEKAKLPVLQPTSVAKKPTSVTSPVQDENSVETIINSYEKRLDANQQTIKMLQSTIAQMKVAETKMTHKIQDALRTSGYIRNNIVYKIYPVGSEELTNKFYFLQRKDNGIVSCHIGSTDCLIFNKNKSPLSMEQYVKLVSEKRPFLMNQPDLHIEGSRVVMDISSSTAI